MWEKKGKEWKSEERKEEKEGGKARQWEKKREIGEGGKKEMGKEGGEWEKAGKQKMNRVCKKNNRKWKMEKTVSPVDSSKQKVGSFFFLFVITLILPHFQ